MKNISAPELAGWLSDTARAAPLLLDVREPWEYEKCRLDAAMLVPMQEIPQRLDEIDQNRPVVCICHHGARSMQVALFLQRQGYGDLYNLTGGMHAWAVQVDPAVATY